ncbi:MAG: type I methionyl aminopeptidase [Verrucomicrobia bacterium]|nr:type I methionyl aminopeptidase [Verrucomicrobiota bacterium]
MVVIKSENEQRRMRSAGRVAAKVLADLCRAVGPGISTRELDELAAVRIREFGGRSAFLGYRGYPCHACISVNDEVVHGLAGGRRLRFGDIVSIDVGVIFEGYIGDNARTVAVGGCDVETQRLLDVTEAALYRGVAAAIAGNRVTDISRAVQTLVERERFSVVREFVGHGVGRAMHEDPQIPNYVDPNCRQLLEPGMTLAIEPMVNAGGADVRVLKDGWTAVTMDGSWSAHFEHTVLVTNHLPEILTREA